MTSTSRRGAAAACTVAVLGAVAALGDTLFADTVKLRSGDVVEGAVEDLGDRLRVKAEGGELSVRWRDVDVVLPGRTPADLLAEKRRGVADGDAPGLCALALWASRNGLAAESRGLFEAALRADPENAAARDALRQQKSDGTWLQGSKLLESKGFVARDGAWLLREEAELRERQAEAQREMRPDEKRVEAILRQAAASPAARKFAVEALAKEPAEGVVRPALRALRGGDPGAREVAATALGRVKDQREILRPLIRSAVMDRERDVRTAAARALRAIGDEDVVKPIARGMWSTSEEIRANATEALGELGGAVDGDAGVATGQVVEWLLTRVSSSSGPGGRNHLFVGSQLSYVSDYDVEIAQAAQIGDPIVQTIREGAMLDFRVLHVREEYTVAERRVAFTQLAKVTGRTFGEDAAAWRKWWDESGRTGKTAAK